MSRDGAPSKPSRRAPGAPADELELLAAYVDGVTELSSEERRQIEARLGEDPGARAEQAAVRRLLDRLRDPAALGEPAEPDFAAMARAIRDAVGEAMPRPWWQRFRWIAPAATFAGAMAVALALWPHGAATAVPARPHAAHDGRAAAAPDAAPAEPRDVVPLWLNGAAIDVDLALVPGAPDGFTGFAGFDDEAEAREAREAGEAGQPGTDPEATADVGLLPATDLAWVDRLDDDALERAERWLAGRPGKRG